MRNNKPKKEAPKGSALSWKAGMAAESEMSTTAYNSYIADIAARVAESKARAGQLTTAETAQLEEVSQPSVETLPESEISEDELSVRAVGAFDSWTRSRVAA